MRSAFKSNGMIWGHFMLINTNICFKFNKCFYITHHLERSRDLTLAFKENFITAVRIKRKKTYQDHLKDCKEGLWEREWKKKETHPDVLYIPQSQPAVCVFVLESPPAAKAQQSRSIRSLFVWLHTSQLGEEMLHQHRVFSRDLPSACGPEVKTLLVVKLRRSKEGGAASHHSAYSNDTLTPAGPNEWKCESAILKRARLFPCFRTDQLRRHCRKCLRLPETVD